MPRVTKVLSAGALVALLAILGFGIGFALARSSAAFASDIHQDSAPQSGAGCELPPPLLARVARNLGLPPHVVCQAFTQAIEEIRQVHGPAGGAPGGGPTPDLILGLSLDLLDLDPQSLERSLREGQTLGQVASERGVAPDALADQLTARLEQIRLQTMREQIRRFLDQSFVPPGHPTVPSG